MRKSIYNIIKNTVRTGLSVREILGDGPLVRRAMQFLTTGLIAFAFSTSPSAIAALYLGGAFGLHVLRSALRAVVGVRVISQIETGVSHSPSAS